MSDTERLIRAYYDAFNAGNKAGFLALLAEDVVHDVNQGAREVGIAAFDAFFDAMSRSYRERLEELVVMVDATGARAAAEFVVHGEYVQSQDGLPAARGQRYVLPAGAFFEVSGGKVARISNTYNLADWLRQVSASG